MKLPLEIQLLSCDDPLCHIFVAECHSQTPGFSVEEMIVLSYPAFIPQNLSFWDFPVDDHRKTIFTFI